MANVSSQDIERQARIEQLRLLYQGIPVAGVISLAIAALAAALMLPVAGWQRCAVWLALMTGLTLARLALYVLFQRRNAADTALRGWYAAFAAGVILSALLWGASVLIFFRPADFEYQVLLAFVLAGITSGAISTLFYDLRLSLAFVVIVMLPLAFHFLNIPTKMMWSMGAMVIIYIVGLSLSAARMFRSTRENIRLRLEEKGRQAELSASQQRLALHVQQTPLASIVWSPDAEVEEWNCAAEKIFGFARREVIGRRPWELIVPAAARASAERQWRELIHSHHSSHDTSSNVTRDGRQIWCEWYNTPLINDRGEVLGVASLAMDVTEQLQAEERLVASEHRFRLLVESAREAFFLHDSQGKLVNVNVAACQSLGYGREELLGMSIFDIEQGLCERRLKALWGDLQQAKHLTIEGMHRRRDGSTFPVELSISLVEEDGQPLFLALARDISARKEFEQALQESERRFRMLADGAPALIWEADEHNQGVWYNRSWLDYTGRTMGQELGLGWAEGVHPDDLEEAVAQCNAAFEARQRFEIEFRLRRADGSYGWLADTGIPKFTEDGRFTGYIGYCWDITDRKETEAALVRARDEAEQASRAKTEFLSRMSHELRTPMNAILGFAQLLERDEEDAERREFIREIGRAGKHLLELINDVLDLARVESYAVSLSFEAVNLEMVLGESIAMLAPLADMRGIVIRDEVSPHGPHWLYADQTRVKQILVNLLSNAVKYNRDRGSVTVTCEEIAAQGRWRVSVADTGSGIAPQHMGSLFQAFERLGAEQSGIEGTGIGLALSKRLVEAMHGEIGGDSVPGQGSVFWFELPVSRDGGARDGPDRLAQYRSSPRPFSVLYIEDNAANLRLVETIVGRLPGVSMYSAPTPQTGLDLAQAHVPDVVLLDINLPGMSGFEVLSRLRAMPALTHTAVIAVTANALPEDVARGREAGFDGYLTKPLDVDRFIETVTEVLNRQARSPA